MTGFCSRVRPCVARLQGQEAGGSVIASFPLAGAGALSAGLRSDMFFRVPQQPMEEYPWAPPFSRCPGHVAHRGAKLGLKSKGSDPRVSSSARFFFHGLCPRCAAHLPICVPGSELGLDTHHLCWFACLAYTCVRTHARMHTHPRVPSLSPWCRPGALRCRVLGASPCSGRGEWPGARLLQRACGCRCRHLEHNSLVEVNSGSLYGLTALHQLHLGNNSISRISRDGWSFCQKLHEL